MKCVVFVPGILGSELVDSGGDRVWPPNAGEVIGGYNRIDELLADDLRATAVIRRVAVFPVYRSILRDLERCGYTLGGQERVQLPYPYDWRRSNADSAAGLAQKLDALEDLEELILIGHSMGGLVLRFLLESGSFDMRPWFEKITTLITLGTPHFGAPKALERLLGNESLLGLRGRDVVRLASDSRYPSAYELVPRSNSALTVPKVPRGEIPRKMDSFDPAIVAALGLNPVNVQAARDFWSHLDLFNRRPAHVRYFFFGGGSHSSLVRNEWLAPQLEGIERRQSGDGTVPIACAIVPELPHGFSRKKHSAIFEDRNLREALFQFLDAPVGVRPQAAGDVVEVGSQNVFGISIDRETYAVGDPIEVVVSYTREVTDPSESFRIFRLDVETGERDTSAPPKTVGVEFKGSSMNGFSFVISPELAPGLYELLPDREVDDPEPTLFFVESDG